MTEIGGGRCQELVGDSFKRRHDRDDAFARPDAAVDLVDSDRQVVSVLRTELPNFNTRIEPMRHL
jgi:hypothetical protein